MPSIRPSPERVRAALDELLAWQGIARSPQLAELLRYVAEKTLAGDEGSIKAYSIAVDVFGRPQTFDPQSDPIVRVQARRLRTLLEQFYDTGKSRTDVQIHLPLGRYVPEFRQVERPLEPVQVTAVPVVVPASAEIRRPRARFLTNASFGLIFTLVGVALAVFIIRWALPSSTPPQGGTPAQPIVTVGNFDNLTGQGVLDDDVRQVREHLIEGLRRFDWLTVVEADGNGPTVRGSVQQDGGRFVVKAILTQGPTGGILWSTSISPQPGQTDTDALAGTVGTITAELGNANGPVHATGRAWLMQNGLPDTPTAYLCDLQYMIWRDNRRLSDADAAIACFTKILAASPEDANALAARAGIRAWRAPYLADPATNLVAELTEETMAVSHAVTLSPQSSFVYEQQALVLGRQGSLDAALGAVRKSLELNPANMDAVALQGIALWLNGSFDEGDALSERAIAGIESPPPWYYMTRAFNTMRQQRFFDALDAAQALAAGDTEFGPVIALAAASRVGRSDLIDRYRPQVMSNERFQSAGILPRLAMLIKPQILLDRIATGLAIAGVPPNALNKPFNPDGTEKK